MAGIIGGLILGPLMPLNVASGEMQLTANWMYRLGMFSLIGSIAGFFIRTLDIQIGKLGWLSYHHPDSGLPNRYALLREIGTIIQNDGLEHDIGIVIMRINNYDALSVIYGIEVTDLLIGKKLRQVQEIVTEISICQILPFMLGFLIRTSNGSYTEKAQEVVEIFKEPLVYKNVPVFIDVSSGMACIPTHGKDPGLVLRKAMIAANASSDSGGGSGGV